MKGIVLTLDAIIAMLLVVSMVSLLTFYRTESTSPFFTTQQLHSLSEDSLSILSESTLSEIVTNQTLLSGYVSQGILNATDLNRSAIDIIGMLWSENTTDTDLAAASISKDILGNILPSNVGYQVLVNDYNVYNSSDTQRPPYSDSGIEISSGRIASGYQRGENVTGFVARAFLTSIAGKEDSSYVYFGGYVGDGNITANITLPMLDNVTEAYMELDVGSNFTLYVNGQYSGNYINGTAGGGLMRSDKWVVCNSTYNPLYCSKYFKVGNNTLNFNFSGNGSFIGGGYFRVTYNTSQLAPEEQVDEDTYWFPGISGFFNLYDSFYVPGTLTNMTSHLHYLNNLTLNQTNATVYLSIGNVKVFRSNNTGVQNFNLSFNDIWRNFSSQQNLINNVSNRTVPIRFGVEGFQVQGGGVGTADAVLITDVSGSMGTCDVNSTPPANVTPDCDSGTAGVQNTRIDVAKNVSKVFVDTVLNTAGDKVGLVAFSAEPGIYSWSGLSNNSAALKSSITNYNSGGFTCTSCGIDNATKILLAQSSSSRFRGILVMSDGQANTMIPGTNGGGGGSTSQCPDTEGFNSSAGAEATNKSCIARNSNITTFGVAFGNDADQEQMKRIACWNCTACPNVCLTDRDCTPSLNQSNCQSMGCNWNSTVLVNNTIFNDGFEVDITTNWTVSPSGTWTRVSNQYHSGSHSGSKASSSSAGNLTSKSVNTSGAAAIYISLWYKNQNLVAGDVYLYYNDSSGNWDQIADLSGSQSNWYNNVTKITDPQYFHSGFAVRFVGKAFSSSKSFWIDDLNITKTSSGLCQNISSSCWIGNVTLPNGTQADCRAVRYAQSNNINELQKIYGAFGNMFAILSYTTQEANITGNISYNNILYPDSYIQFNYTPVIMPYDYGEVSLTRESPRLGDLNGNTIDMPYKEGWFNISNDVKVVDAKITSYSSDFWTDMLWINSSATRNWTAVYNLTKYGNDYTPLGDPFIIHMPIDKVSSGNNSVRIETATSPVNKTGGSPDDRVIYTIRVKGSVGYGDVNETEEGALNDAIQRLINLIRNYVNVTTDDIQTEANSIGGVSYMWGPADVKVKVWS